MTEWPLAANLIRRGDDVDADHLLGQHRLGVDTVEPRAKFSVLGHCLKGGGGKKKPQLKKCFICLVLMKTGGKNRLKNVTRIHYEPDMRVISA